MEIGAKDLSGLIVIFLYIWVLPAFCAWTCVYAAFVLELLHLCVGQNFNQLSGAPYLEKTAPRLCTP